MASDKAPLSIVLKNGAACFLLMMGIVAAVSGCAFFVPAMDDSLTEKSEKEKKEQEKAQEKQASPSDPK